MYQIIYADPPWQFGSKSYQDGERSMLKLEETQYETMSISQIKNMPIKNITDKDCICFMWVTDAHLKEGIEVLEAWGFKYKTIGFNWIKYYESGAECVNFAPWTLKSWEVCLIGIKGSMGKHKKVNNIQGLLKEVRTQHSKKPNEARKRIETLFGDLPRLEMFAREKHEGWDVFGNEVENSITLGEQNQ